MENEVAGPSREGGGKPEWFLGWLKEVFLPSLSKDPLSSQVEVFSDAVEKLPDLEDSVKKMLTTTFANETRINLAKEEDRHAVAQLLKAQKLPDERQAVQMPWSLLTESGTKIVSKAIENFKELDFSTKSLKYWRSYFENVLDKFFFTSQIGKIAAVFNSCSLSLKQRILRCRNRG